jgi:hypothetical protein
MKLNIIIFLTIILTFNTCTNKEIAHPIRAIVMKNWVLTSNKYNGNSEYMQECDKDDIWMFQPSMSLLVNLNTDLCNFQSSEHNMNSTFKFSDDDKAISFSFKNKQELIFEIAVITESAMILKSSTQDSFRSSQTMTFRAF